MNNLYTIPELAHKLDINRHTLSHWLKNGEIVPFYTVGELSGGKRMPLFDELNIVQSKAWTKYISQRETHKKKGPKPVDK